MSILRLVLIEDTKELHCCTLDFLQEREDHLS